MDAAALSDLAKRILDFSVLSTSLTYQQILAIKAAIPRMDLTPQQKEQVLGRMRSPELAFEIEANKRITKKLKIQLAAREEKRREAAIKRTSETSSNWLNKISQKMQELLGFKNGLYERIPSLAQEGSAQSKEIKYQ